MSSAGTAGAGLLALALSCVPTSAASEPYEIRATWADDRDTLSPARLDFRFVDLDVHPRYGVVALGDRLILRVRNDEPHVTLALESLWNDPALAPTALALGGDRRALSLSGTTGLRPGVEAPATSNALLEEREGKWHSLALPSISDAAWFFQDVISTPTDDVFAIVSNTGRLTTDPVDQHSGALPWLNKAFVTTTTGWREITPSVPPMGRILDACVTTSGELVVVGRARSNTSEPEGGRLRGFASRFDPADRRWTTLSIDDPAGDVVRWSVTNVACAEDGRIWISVDYILSADRTSTTYFLEHAAVYAVEEETTVAPLPIRAPPSTADKPGFATITALAVHRNATWVAYSTSEKRTHDLLRWEDGHWQAFPAPAVPGVAQYAIRRIAFDDAGTGWAISNAFGGVARPENRGILLRFDGERWRLQNWTWSVWRQRWFGLLGPLR